MTQTPIRIIQISDIHLFSDKESALLGVKTDESFRVVRDLVATNEKKIDLILLTGDLSQDGSVNSYQRLAEYLKTFTAPIYYVPGNHDYTENMRQVYPCGSLSDDKQILIRDWQLILLDSQLPGKVEGHLNQDQLDFLEKCLKEYPKKRAVIIFHHQPMPVGSQWLDQLGINNSGEMWQILARHPQVHTVFFGHVHQEFNSTRNDIPCYALPSTCIQFKPHKDDFGLDNIPPGYRWIELYDDGRIATDIVRSAHYVGVFDKDAKGY